MERDVDARMPRTANRPAGRPRRGSTATAYGVALAVASLRLLATKTPALTASLAFFAFASYLGVYTPLKRVTTLNTFVGAIPGALPPVLGWTAARGELGAGAFALFAILYLWQLPHFLAIAWLYRRDYELGGLVMLPARPGGRDDNAAVVPHAVGSRVSALRSLRITARSTSWGSPARRALPLAVVPVPARPPTERAASRVARLPARAPVADRARLVSDDSRDDPVQQRARNRRVPPLLFALVGLLISPPSATSLLRPRAARPRTPPRCSPAIRASDPIVLAGVLVLALGFRLETPPVNAPVPARRPALAPRGAIALGLAVASPRRRRREAHGQRADRTPDEARGDDDPTPRNISPTSAGSPSLIRHRRQAFGRELLGKIWVADFVFTNCSGPCIPMTQGLRTAVQDLRGEPDVEFVTITVDPETDTPDVLRNFATARGGLSPRWHWLSGDKAVIFQLLRELTGRSATSRRRPSATLDALLRGRP
jgi:hypothetical protein